MAYGFSRCICNEAIDLIGIDLLSCAHAGEPTTTHDAVGDFFASIAKDVMFHVLHEQTHVLSMSSLQSSWR
jgi:hypothetical protein